MSVIVRWPLKQGVSEDDANLLTVGGGEFGDRFAKHGAAAAIGTRETEDGFEGSGFAGAVAADEASHIAGADFQRAVEMKSGVGFLQVVKCDHSDPSKRCQTGAHVLVGNAEPPSFG